MFCCNSRDDGSCVSKDSSSVGEHKPSVMFESFPRGQALQSIENPSLKVGVGIVFQPDPTGAFRSLALGGPAGKCNLVHIGDVLHEIDGHQVLREPAGRIAPLILGCEGSFRPPRVLSAGKSRADPRRPASRPAERPGRGHPCDPSEGPLPPSPRGHRPLPSYMKVEYDVARLVSSTPSPR